MDTCSSSLTIVVICLTALVSFTDANTCTQSLQGHCYDLVHGLNGACTPGHVYTLNYCGVFQMCCYYHQNHPATHPPITTHKPPAHTTQAAHVTQPPSTGQCGHSIYDTTSTKIVGGTSAHHGQFPWQVSLRYYGQHVCGGTLIGDQYILTAAHCFEELGTGASHWTVGVGLQDQRQVYQSNVYHVSHVNVHEHFNINTNTNDIAIMKLSKRVDITGRYARPACLPTSSHTFDSDICVVSGWGATYYDPQGRAPITNDLEYVSIRTISNQLCQYYLGYSNVHSTNLCAGVSSTGGKDACQGDSGGPLVCKKNGAWEIAGVVSWGDGCGKAARPGVYTRVTSYLNWVNQKMRH